MNIDFGSVINKPVVLKLRNALGVVVKEKTVDVNVVTEQLFLDQLARGIYFLEVEINGERKHIEKVLIVE